MSKLKKSLLIFAGMVLVAFVVSVFVVRQAWREDVGTFTIMFLCLPALLITMVMLFRKKWRQKIYIPFSVFLGFIAISCMFLSWHGFHFKMNPEKQAVRLVKKTIRESDRDNLQIVNIEKGDNEYFDDCYYFVSAKDNARPAKYNEVIGMNEDSVVFFVVFSNIYYRDDGVTVDWKHPYRGDNRWYNFPEVYATRNFERKLTDDELRILRKAGYYESGKRTSVLGYIDEDRLSSGLLNYLRRAFSYSAISGRATSYNSFDGKIKFEIDHRDKTETFVNPKILFVFDKDINKREVVTFDEVIKPGKVYRKEFCVETGHNCENVSWLEVPEEFNDDEWLIQYLLKQPESEWNKCNHYIRYWDGYYKDSWINYLFDE